MLQRKILRVICFRKRSDSLEDGKFLTVHELHIYELLEFVYRSVYNLHGDEELNKWFTEIDDNAYRTRRSIKPYLKLPKAKTEFKRLSIVHRCCKLYNLLLEKDV